MLKWFFDISTSFRFQRSVWECSVHICSCPCLRHDIKMEIFSLPTKLLLLIYQPGLDPCFTISYTTVKPTTHSIQKSKIWNPKSETQSPKLKIRNSKSETQNPKSESHNVKKTFNNSNFNTKKIFGLVSWTNYKSR